jgi:hypothetical protein
LENFDWHKVVNGSIIVDKSGKEESEKTKKDKYTEKGKIQYFLDLATYQVQKIDENRTKLTQIHLFDAGGWTTPKLQRYVINDRGVKLRKKCLEHIKNKPKDFGFESLKEKLSQDLVGRLILELDIPKIQKDYDEKIKNEKDKSEIKINEIENENKNEKVESENSNENKKEKIKEINNDIKIFDNNSNLNKEIIE